MTSDNRRYQESVVDLVRVTYSASEDGYQEIFSVECAEHGTVALYGDGRSAWARKRAHEARHESDIS